MSDMFEPKFVSSCITEIVDDLLNKKGGLTATQLPESSAKDILEYEGCMRVSGMDKFNSPSFIAVSSLYLNETDMHKGKARGAMALFMDSDGADKLFKALGYAIPYDEDDESMMGLCEKFMGTLLEAFKVRFSGAGYVDLLYSAPTAFKNSVPVGLAFSPDQHKKQEINFYYFKHKAVVVEASLAPIPKK